MFVEAATGVYAALGIGKLIDQDGNSCLVEYFDAPGAERIVHRIDEECLRQATVNKQTRVYYFDYQLGQWLVGLLMEDQGTKHLIGFSQLDHRLLDVEDVFVRWSPAIKDPSVYLSYGVNESLEFCDARSSFVRSQIQQRAASYGISALLSCAIELEAHQIEVVRRVLQDPVQRYLLADEVGLGKTVEAGVLIRQCVLDTDQNCVILIIVPISLIDQWLGELCSKFFLGRFIYRQDPLIHVLALGDDENIKKILPKVTMLVIDEAHHLTDMEFGGRGGIYADIARTAPKIERVLLLSATPALHNEVRFLEMLHLLDPSAYPLNGLEAFHKKVSGRQSLAQIVAGLTPENLFFLGDTIDQLAPWFAEDDLLRTYAYDLKEVVETIPDEDDPELLDGISRLHSHLSEVYRLHRRILRHRRVNLIDLIPDRGGLEIVHYTCGDRSALMSAIDNWRFEEVTKLDANNNDAIRDARTKAYKQVLNRASQYANSFPGAIGFLAQRSDIVGDVQKFGLVARLLGQADLFEKRSDAMIEALVPHLDSKTQCIIFCSDKQTADSLTSKLKRRLTVQVVRHDPKDKIQLSAGHDVLVCDQKAEEGLNLQGGRKILVHYDLPFNPNRVEQRLGRADRYGAKEPIRSMVLVCNKDPIEMEWVNYLNNALKLFNRSVASLQYLIAKTEVNLFSALFTDGAEALLDLIAISSGDTGTIDQELKALEQQDALDALGTPPLGVVDDLARVDQAWRSLAVDATRWLERSLRFGIDEDQKLQNTPTDQHCRTLPLFLDNPPKCASMATQGGILRYVYSDNEPATLLPRTAFWSNCKEALDVQWDVAGKTTIRTFPYTFSRQTSLAQSTASIGSGVSLLRYGDPLMSGVTALTERGDYGQSFAIWRYLAAHGQEHETGIYLRFDFIVETDLAIALGALNQLNRRDPSTISAIRRRADMAFPPSYHTIWLDRQLECVTDELILSQLRGRQPASPDMIDINLGPRCWKNLETLNIPEVTYWSDFCAEASNAAGRVLLGTDDLLERIAKAERVANRVDFGRIGQLKARAETNHDKSVSDELAFEDQIASALKVGIHNPHVRLDTLGAIFLSNDPNATARIGVEPQ